MDFTSDNVCGISPEILTALSHANGDVTAAPYGADDMSMALNQTLSAFFQRDAFVFTVTTGTAANALALSACCQPWQAVLTHQGAHINVMECGAPESITGGVKIIGIPGEQGKLSCEGVINAVQDSGQGIVHRSQVSALSLAQTTDRGTVYTVKELQALTKCAKDLGLHVHLDGARFANAVAALDCHPAELVKDVDVLSFGTSKNGTLNAEAIVFFDQNLARDFGYRLKQAGHLVSKARFLSAQILAYVKDDLWLKNAQHANRCAAQLAGGLGQFVELVEPVDSNIVFATVPVTLHDALRDAGVRFYSHNSETPGARVIRLVTGFSTNPADIQALVNLVGELQTQALAA